MRRLLMLLTNHPLPRFVIVGSLAFLVDATLLYLFSLFLNLMLARLISFIFASSSAWALNRKFTFRSKDPAYKQEWMRYSLIASLAGGLNYFSFLTLIYFFEPLHEHPILALAIATSVSAIFNFYFARNYSFKSISTLKS